MVTLCSLNDLRALAQITLCVEQTLETTMLKLSPESKKNQPWAITVMHKRGVSSTLRCLLSKLMRSLAQAPPRDHQTQITQDVGVSSLVVFEATPWKAEAGSLPLSLLVVTLRHLLNLAARSCWPLPASSVMFSLPGLWSSVGCSPTPR